MKTRYEIEQDIRHLVRQHRRTPEHGEDGVSLEIFVEYIANREEKWSGIVDDLLDAISFSNAIPNFVKQEKFVLEFVNEVREITDKAVVV